MDPDHRVPQQLDDVDDAGRADHDDPRLDAQLLLPPREDRRGKDGVAVLWEEEVFEVPGIPITTLDTTGAGDVFHGAFLYGVLQGRTLGGCLRLANTAAALSCTQMGARGGIPRLDTVLAMV